jgi:uncharacterized protein (TIGR02147 family)
MVQAVRIFAYLDYRLFLRDFYRQEKARRPAFSHRFIAERVGAKSAGWFSDVVKGRIKLSDAHLDRLLPLLKLRPDEEEYFETLVRIDRAPSEAARLRLVRKLVSLRELPAHIVGEEAFDFYGSWYPPVLRELLLFHDFKGDHAALGKLLRPALKPHEAREAVELLERLGLIRLGNDGVFRPAARTLRKDSSLKSSNIAGYMKANMGLAARALDTLDREERDISCLTLAFSEEGFRKAREEVRVLRKRLLALAEETGPPERVFQANFQLFPVTGKVGAAEA